MHLVYCSARGSSGTVGSNLVFLVAMRSLLAVFNGISVLNLHCAFVSTTPGRWYNPTTFTRCCRSWAGRELRYKIFLLHQDTINRILGVSVLCTVSDSCEKRETQNILFSLKSSAWSPASQKRMRLWEGMCCQCQLQAFSLCCFSGPRALPGAAQDWSTSSPLFINSQYIKLMWFHNEAFHFCNSTTWTLNTSSLIGETFLSPQLYPPRIISN